MSCNILKEQFHNDIDPIRKDFSEQIYQCLIVTTTPQAPE